MNFQEADVGWEPEHNLSGLKSASMEGTEGSRGTERTLTVV